MNLECKAQKTVEKSSSLCGGAGGELSLLGVYAENWPVTINCHRRLDRGSLPPQEVHGSEKPQALSDNNSHHQHRATFENFIDKLLLFH